MDTEAVGALAAQHAASSKALAHRLSRFSDLRFFSLIGARYLKRGCRKSATAGLTYQTAADASKLMRKVSLIEYDGDLSEGIVAGLANQRFEVECASNGLEGLKMARALKPHALIVDRQLPGLDGFAGRSDELLTRTMLLKDVWNYNFDPKTNLVDVHMGRVRRKVDGRDEAPMIYNIRGAGFILREARLYGPADASIRNLRLGSSLRR